MLLQLRNKGHPGSQINERTWKSAGGGPKEAVTFLRREPESPELASCLHPRGPPTPQRDAPFCTAALCGSSCLSAKCCTAPRGAALGGLYPSATPRIKTMSVITSLGEAVIPPHGSDRSQCNLEVLHVLSLK